MIAAQVAGRPGSARTPEVLLRGCAVAVPSLPSGAAAIAAVLFLTRLRVHW